MENNSIKPAATLVKKTDLPKTKTATSPIKYETVFLSNLFNLSESSLYL